MSSRERPAADLRRRLRLAGGVAAAALLGLSARAYQLQIARGAELTGKLDDARAERVRLGPPRGTLRDARGEVVAEDGVAYDAYVLPYALGFQREERMPRLAAALDLDEEEQGRLRARLDALPQSARRTPLLVKRDVGAAAAETLRRSLRGEAQVRERAARRHPHGALAIQAIGYLNEVLPEEVDRDYRPGDRTGRAGVERAFEGVLRGSVGFTFRPASRWATLPEGREAVQPLPGRDVTLSLDLELTRAVDDAFEEQQQHLGAGVLLDARTGRVLAMTSRPSFDPDLLDRGLPLPTEGRPELDRVTNDPLGPVATFQPFAGPGAPAAASGAALGAALGPGDVALTPLQLAVAYAALANGGTIFEPGLVLRAGDDPVEPVVRRKLDVPQADLARVRAALRANVAGAGHGGVFADLRGRVAGTMGVALSPRPQALPAVAGPPREDGWFAGFAPADAPEVVVVVSTRDTTTGAERAAAAIAAGALRAYFADRDGGSR